MSSGDPFDFNDADDDDDRPRRRRRDDDFDDDDDRPRRSPRRGFGDERDDFDDYPRRPPSDGLGITSMVLGIASCAIAVPGLCCILFTGVSVLLGIVAVILGFVARSQRPESGAAKAGIITGFIGAGLSILMFVLAIALNIGQAMLN